MKKTISLVLLCIATATSWLGANDTPKMASDRVKVTFQNGTCGDMGVVKLSDYSTALMGCTLNSEIERATRGCLRNLIHTEKVGIRASTPVIAYFSDSNTPALLSATHNVETGTILIELAPYSGVNNIEPNYTTLELNAETAHLYTIQILSENRRPFLSKQRDSRPRSSSPLLQRPTMPSRSASCIQLGNHIAQDEDDFFLGDAEHLFEGLTRTPTPIRGLNSPGTQEPAGFKSIAGMTSRGNSNILTGPRALRSPILARLRAESASPAKKVSN